MRLKQEGPFRSVSLFVLLATIHLFSRIDVCEE